MFVRVPRANSRITDLQLAMELSQDPWCNGKRFKPFTFKSNMKNGSECSVCPKRILPNDHAIPYEREGKKFYMHAEHADAYNGLLDTTLIYVSDRERKTFRFWAEILEFIAEKDRNSTSSEHARSTRYYHKVAGAFIAHQGEALSPGDISGLIDIEPEKIRSCIQSGGISKPAGEPVRAFKESLYKEGADSWVFDPFRLEEAKREKESNLTGEIQGRVIRIFQRNPKKVLGIAAIADELKLSHEQISGAISGMKISTDILKGQFCEGLFSKGRGKWAWYPQGDFPLVEEEAPEEHGEAPAPTPKGKMGEIKQINTTNQGRIIRMPDGGVVYSDEDCVVDLIKWQEHSY